MKNFSLVSIFNSSKTLNENNEVVINEGNTLSTLAAAFKDAESLKTANPSMFKTFQDILKFSGDEGKYIEGFTGPNRTNFTKIKTVDELLYAVKNGMQAKDLGRFYTGCLKSANTPMELVTLSAKEVANSPAFIKKYSTYTPNNLKIELKNRKYSDAAVNALLNETKGKSAFNAAKTAAKKLNKLKAGGGEVELTTTSNGEIIKPNADGTSLTVTNPETKSVVEISKQKLNELLTGVKSGWNWKKVLAWGAVIGLGAAALWWAICKSSDTIPDDMPIQEPPVGTKWDPCIKELIDSKEAQITTDVNAVIVKPTDFPGGLEFFNNGRVMDIAGKKMGTWKCKGTTPVISEGTQKISLNGLLDEQGNIKTAKEVDTMYVRKKSSSDIADITWDGQKKPVIKSKYHDCSGKDTFEFGCRAQKIKEIQICLGMEGRYQTGNFGPLTKKALEDAGYDVSQGITVDIYNKIKAACTDNSNVRAPKLDGSIEPLKTNKTPVAPVNINNLKLPNIQPVGQGNRGESIYNGLKNNFGDGTNPEMPYIFSSGGRLKYKGDELGEDVLGQLDQYIGTLGYQRIKEKDKDYGVKYVWAKQ